MFKQRPFYSSFAWAYDLIISAPVKQRCDFIERVLTNKDIKAPIHILDAGCGTGSYAIELAHRGYQVTGVDISEDQIKHASNKAKVEEAKVNFYVDDLLEFKHSQKYDIILCRGVLNDLLLDQERSDVFKTFAKVSKSGSLLIFDVRDWVGSVRQKTDDPVTTKELETDRGHLKFTSKTILNEKEHLLEIHERHILTTSKGIEKYDWDLKMRCWTVEEVSSYLREAGFELVHQYGGYDEKTDLGQTERIVTIAIKN